jgi:membrane protein implicated in regulation of membrane protease activity
MTIRNAFWLMVIGLVCMYGFFVALGAFDPTETVGASVAVLVLAALWGVHAALEHRHHTEIERDRSIRAARERRGF